VFGGTKAVVTPTNPRSLSAKDVGTTTTVHEGSAVAAPSPKSASDQSAARSIGVG